MSRADLAREFLEAQENSVKEGERPTYVKKSSDDDNQIRFGLSAGETSKTFQGYFLTAPGNKFNRMIKNIHRFGCNSKKYGTIGFRCMDPEDYVIVGTDPLHPDKGITPSQKNKLKTFISLFAQVNDSKKLGKVTDNDPLMYCQYVKNLEIFYMYLTDLQDKDGAPTEGIRLVTTKSRSFMKDRLSWTSTLNTTYEKLLGKDEGNKKFLEFINNMVDNDIPKSDKIIINIKQSSGYKFEFSSEDVSPAFQIPQDKLATLKDLDTLYISRYEIDEAELDKNIAILTRLLSQIQDLEAKNNIANAVKDPYKD